MPLSSQDVLKAFDRIRVFQRGEQRAVHKPLLILMALARIAQGAPRMVRFDEIDAPFKQLLAEFGPSSAPSSRHYPFWHLATDGLWQLDGPASLLNRPAFGVYMQNVGANRAYEPAALAVIAFGITWGCLGLMQLVSRLQKTAPRQA